MRDIPECMNRRYRVVDELVMDLTRDDSCRGSVNKCSCEPKNDVGVKLLCDFWKILKENPEYNLVQAVKQRMGVVPTSRRCSHPHRVTCYMAGNERQDDVEDLNDIEKHCCDDLDPTFSEQCCASKSISPSNGSDVLPLSKVLCNLKEAASFDKKCNARIDELMQTQKEVKDQIKHLEQREKEGTELLKQADCMWSCMEDTYKKKLADSLEKQNNLLKQIKEVEASGTKWRKNKKDLELQLDNINKCQQEITEKTNQKTNDIKRIDMEIANFKKRIESNKKDTEIAKKSLGIKKQASDAKIANLATELLRQQKILSEVNKTKQLKENEGTKYVKEAREELQKICRVLLEKKLKNEDFKAEKEALNTEIEFLRKTCDKCIDKCKNKQQSIIDEIKAIEKEIGEFKIKCIRCHQCTDTVDIRKLCTDCPRCVEERDCLYENDHCSHDYSVDCVCMSVKQKFLDNVFDNMYTVLERQTKTKQGKRVAEAVLSCLKRSRNGKLDDDTRKILQDFILTTVKKNLNLTIIGGAVKTRCEMDAETYKQLMLCLKLVKIVRPPKEDKAIPAKKEPCGRWGGSSECNCPKGPKSCICSRKAPPPPSDPTPCPPEKDDVVDIIACPHKESVACGPDCANHAVPSRISLDMSAWRPAPCKESSCPFTNNMRAAQCVLGPEALCSLSNGFISPGLYQSNLSSHNEMVICKCGSSPTKPCVCRETKHLKSAISEQKDKATNNEERTRYILQNDLIEENKVDTQRLSKQKCRHHKVLRKSDTFSNKKSISKQNISIKPYDNSTVIILHPKEWKQDKINDQFMSDNVNIELKKQYVELTTTDSGDLAIELDEKFIENIEKKLQKDPHINISVKKTDSNRYFFNFKSGSNTLMSNSKIIMKKTPSGTNVFEINKDFLNEMERNNIQNKKNNEVGLNVVRDYSDIEINKHIKADDLLKKNLMSQNNAIDSLHGNNNKIIDLTYLCSMKDVPLRILGRNGVCKDIQAPVTRTLSGNIAIDIKSILTFGEISFTNKEYPVVLDKTSSNKLLLNIGKNSISNATLRRTSSGGIVLIGIKPVLTSLDTTKKIRENNGYFKVKVKDIKNNIKEPPAVLQATPSNNYMIVFDKEYENNYLQTINEHIGEDNECLVQLHRTASDNFMITFNEMYEVSALVEQYTNAVLTKQSGSIKILDNGPIFDAMDRDILRKTSAFSAKAYETLLEKLPNSNKDLNINKRLKNNLHYAKPSSDSDFYDKEKWNITDQQTFGTLKRTASGHHTIVLDKESKKAFVKRLKKYLRGTQGLIPIKKSESGELTINLNREDESKIGYGSLKITPSGNIYVNIDDKVIRDTKKGSDSYKNNNIRSRHIIGRIKQPVNKSVTTTCNAKPDSSFCKFSKCVCNKLDEQTQRWLQNKTIQHSLRLFHPKNFSIDWKERNKDHNRQAFGNPEKFEMYTQDESIEKSSHVTTNSCDCSPKIVGDPKSRESYFTVDAICPINADLSKAVWNEFRETAKKKSNNERNTNATHHVQPDSEKHQDRWDSLSYLPPQLPAFLNGYRYR